MNSHEQSLGMGNKTRLMAEKKIVKIVSCQKLALIIRKKKVEKFMTQEELQLEKPWRRHNTWKKIDAYVTIPNSSPLFFSVNISAMVSSPQPQHPSP